ncbi:MAG: UDP-diphosphatase [Desulfuromonas sp.]|nr:MAG: UDP-diphosphatase [Desulfuromonas sp.]
MTLEQAIGLGALQGATEFLPVSSSGHLALAQSQLSGFSQPGVLFDVLLHFGTMIAVLIYFWRDIRNLATAPFRKDETATQDRRMLLLLIVGSIPTAIIGLAGKDFATGLFHNVPVVAAMLIVTGSLLFLSERLRSSDSGSSKIGYGDALLTGIAQGLAIIPGISRSGSTIATMLLRGIDGVTAARFSFLLALPAVGGATLLSIKDMQQVAPGELTLYAAGAGTALLTGLLSIHFLLAIIRRKRLYYFAFYCWAIGALFLTLSLA